MKWHDDANTRARIGNEVEDKFSDAVICSCGGRFNFIGDSYPGCPDFTCENCGQLVDVKSSPQAERTGNLSVSVVPWSNYPDELLIVMQIAGRWIGEYKRYIQLLDSAPQKATHHSQHPKFGNTSFHLIAWKNFRSLESLGFQLAE